MGISKQFMEQGADGKVLLCMQEWRERVLWVGGVFQRSITKKTPNLPHHI